MLLAVAITDYGPIKGPWAGEIVTCAETVPEGFVCINSWLQVRLRELGWFPRDCSQWWGGDDALAMSIKTSSDFVAQGLEELAAYLEVPPSEDVGEVLKCVCERLSGGPYSLVSEVRQQGRAWFFKVGARSTSLAFPLSVQEAYRELSA